MITEMNKLFAKHKYKVWITIGAAIIIPFVFMVPGADSGCSPRLKNAEIGTMYGQKIKPDQFPEIWTISRLCATDKKETNSRFRFVLRVLSENGS